MNNLEWYAKTEQTDSYTPTNEMYAGTLNKQNSINLYLQLWNNRFGDEIQPDVSNFNINMFFEYEEDKTLLNNCNVSVNGQETEIQIVDNIGTINTSSITLSGAINDGIELNSKANYCELTFTFSLTENKQFKPSDLKNLYFEIVKI